MKRFRSHGIPSPSLRTLSSGTWNPWASSHAALRAPSIGRRENCKRRNPCPAAVCPGGGGQLAPSKRTIGGFRRALGADRHGSVLGRPDLTGSGWVNRATCRRLPVAGPVGHSLGRPPGRDQRAGCVRVGASTLSQIARRAPLPTAMAASADRDRLERPGSRARFRHGPGRRTHHRFGTTEGETGIRVRMISRCRSRIKGENDQGYFLRPVHAAEARGSSECARRCRWCWPWCLRRGFCS